MKWAPDS